MDNFRPLEDIQDIPLPKDSKATFAVPNCRPIGLLPVLSKLLEKIVFNQIMKYFNANLIQKLFTVHAQHAYRQGHSTNTVLSHMTVDVFG